MYIISVLNQKGGCGKTTLATNLSCALYRAGKEVLLVDSDPQGSARDWQAANESNPIPLVSIDRPNNFRTINSISVGKDVVLIDGAGKFAEISSAVVKVSDLVLIPVQPSPYDIWAVHDLLSMIMQRRELTEGKPKAAFVITRAIQNTKLGGDVEKALFEYELPVFSTRVIQRQIYPQTAMEGLSVFDSKNIEAINEINGVAEEVMLFMDDQEVRRVENA